MISRWLFVHLVFSIVVAPPLLHAQTAEKTTPGDGMEVFRSEQVYNSACASCHGRTGDGNGPAARYLNPRPRDFRSGTYKFRSTPDGELPTSGDLFHTVKFGIPRTTMPAWEGLLTEREIQGVVAYIKTFSTEFQEFGSGTPVTIPAEPQATPQSTAEGKNMYMIMQCWSCHGATGKGDGASSNNLKDEWGHAVKPFDFTIGNYKAGKENPNVYKTLFTGLNGTPMPSYAGAILFGEVSDATLAAVAEVYSESEMKTLSTYLESQPTGAELDAMTEAELRQLVDRRIWAMVHFVKSLSRKPGILYTWFVEDTEVTQ